MTISLTDVTETATPNITNVRNAAVNENAAFTSATPSVSGAIGDVTWSLEGDDSADFTIDSATGVVSMVARDFEAPVDEDTDNVYAAAVKVTDADDNTASVNFEVTVRDVTESATPMISGVVNATVNENTAYVSATPGVSGAHRRCRPGAWRATTRRTSRSSAAPAW